MKRLLFFAATAATLLTSAASAQQLLSWDEAYVKADKLISQLSIDEKIRLTRGYSEFFFNGVPEKGIPYVYLSDATQGVHMRNNLPDGAMVRQLETSTAMPSPIALAATFNPALAYTYGHDVGVECRAGGVEVLLGPGVNIYRTAQCGRNFEYFGEDPYLSARIAENYIKGMQSTGTAACMKHFVCNNTEFLRRRSNSIVDERTLNEIYLPAFKAGIDAGVAFVMTSYNQLNGAWTGQDATTIKGILRKQLGFRGGVMTDWRSVYDFEKIIKSGQNVEMDGSRTIFSPTLRELYDAGKVSEAEIVEMIRPIVATCVAYGFYDRPKYDDSLLSEFAVHNQTVYNVAAEGTVLLENNGILPLDPTSGARILVTGKYLTKIPRGAGSAAVEGYDNITLTAALRKAFGNKVTFVQKPTREDLAAADIVIVSTGTNDAEGEERPFNLPKSEEQKIVDATSANPNTIVLVNSGSGIRMTQWAKRAAAVLYGWYPGQCGFTAIVDILTGKISPSGKMPCTIEKDFADSPAVNTVPKGAKLIRNYNEFLYNVYDVKYDEGVLVGYRWYDTKNIEPLYPFGYGLSYTNFTVSGAKIVNVKKGKTTSLAEPVKVQVNIANTGKTAGAEVLQLYVTENSPKVLRPAKELKGIRKVMLAAGEKQTVEFELPREAFAYWDIESHAWKVEGGAYTIHVGTSSRDIKATLAVDVKM